LLPEHAAVEFRQPQIPEFLWKKKLRKNSIFDQKRVFDENLNEFLMISHCLKNDFFNKKVAIVCVCMYVCMYVPYVHKTTFFACWMYDLSILDVWSLFLLHM
jgi:hypothetical protein